ncbi:hypothetical protein PoB_004570600 [Plakobranchus ocellatus]|uniref:Uncharacterized protein n=1 Tax=Plakobranchus ocellatus TaxID=259542 RepID=A0AAV4BJQ6_9GAST|nr:hypothetical protein PoB_004570600 [Plakobranchus ocellatus]
MEFDAVIAVAASPQQGDLKLSGPPPGQGASGGARTRDRRVSVDLRTDSLVTVPPTPPRTLGADNSRNLIDGHHPQLTGPSIDYTNNILHNEDSHIFRGVGMRIKQEMLNATPEKGKFGNLITIGTYLKITHTL